MNIEISRCAGFCYGVKRAVKMAKDAGEKGKGVKTLGPLIHNEQMVKKLSEEGIEPIESIKGPIEGALVIRSHGVPPEVIKRANQFEISTVDATCPYVKRIQNKVRECYNDGLHVVIVGDKNHPEIIGINGWCENTAQVVNSIEEAKDIEDRGPSCLVVQTTYSQEGFEQIVFAIKKRLESVRIYNTICSATTNRQDAAKKLAARVDAMIVVGGKKSANTKKLFEICKSLCKNTFHVQTSCDLLMTQLKKYDRIGITAGASTPDWILEDILKKLEKADELPPEI